jgi:hypothetical protein
MTCFEVIMAGLTAVYVGSTIFYAFTSHKTLKAIEKQGEDNAQQFTQQITEATKSADAARDGAIAARDSADALVASERAWIMVNLAWCDNLRIFQTTRHNGSIVTGINIECICTNQGRTPALITEIRCVLKFSDLDLETVPNFDHAEPYYSEPEPIPSARDSKPYQLQPGCDGEWDKQILIFYGIVKYRDMFGFDRYTTFGYVIGQDQARTIKRISGYPRYNWNA